MNRPRLLDALRLGPEPLRLIVAPRGAGKTVLAAQLVAAAPSDVLAGWCRVAPGSTSAAGLVALAWQALRAPEAQHLAAGDTGSAGDPNPGPVALTETLLDAIGDRPTWLVIDDYSLARSETCDAVLAEAAALAPEECRIVVCSSTRPAGLLGRAATGLVRVIDAEDLAFTADEATSLLAALGRDPNPAAAEAVMAATGGWPAAIAVAAEAGDSTGDQERAAAVLVERVLSAGDAATRETMIALATAGALGAAELTAAGLDPGALGRLSGSALVRPVGDRWALVDAARIAVSSLATTAEEASARQRLGLALASSDPLTATGLLIDAGEVDAAVGVLAATAGSLPVAEVLPVLYRLPDHRRRALPPVLHEARATVELDAALTEAEARASQAGDPAERSAALVALGTVLAHRGQLGASADALERAQRLATQAPVRATATTWLGLVRLWAGDIGGSAAAEELAPDTPLGAWLAGEIALARDPDASGTEAVAAAERPGAGPIVAAALRARVALARGDETSAAEQAAQAYAAASTVGGMLLASAAPVHAWCLARAGDWDQAAAVADGLRRSLGKVDTGARLQADLVALAAATAAEDQVAVRRARDAIGSARRLGYSLLEAGAVRWLPGLARPKAAGLGVGVLGPITVAVDGQPVPDQAWRSRKAREVLVALVLAGPHGLHREQVIEAVWPGREPGKGRTLLRTALAEIRRVLEPERPAGEPSRFVHTLADRVTVVEARTDWEQARALLADGDAKSARALVRGAFAADEPYAASLDDIRPEVEHFLRELLDIAPGG